MTSKSDVKRNRPGWDRHRRQDERKMDDGEEDGKKRQRLDRSSGDATGFKRQEPRPVHSDPVGNNQALGVSMAGDCLAFFLVLFFCPNFHLGLFFFPNFPAKWGSSLAQGASFPGPVPSQAGQRGSQAGDQGREGRATPRARSQCPVKSSFTSSIILAARQRFWEMDPCPSTLSAQPRGLHDDPPRPCMEP